MNDFHGHCLCGTVAFRVTPPTLFCVHCHCRYCRGAHGAAFVTWVGVREDTFAFDQGEELVHWYRSSPQSRRGFCSRCGATMLYVSTLSPGEVHVARACIEETIDREPRAHVFFDHRVPWVTVEDELKKVPSDDPRLERYGQVQPLS